MRYSLPPSQCPPFYVSLMCGWEDVNHIHRVAPYPFGIIKIFFIISFFLFLYFVTAFSSFAPSSLVFRVDDLRFVFNSSSPFSYFISCSVNYLKWHTMYCKNEDFQHFFLCISHVWHCRRLEVSWMTVYHRIAGGLSPQ